MLRKIYKQAGLLITKYIMFLFLQNMDPEEIKNFQRSYDKMRTSLGPETKKNSLASSQARQEGNLLFRQEIHSADIHKQILIKYTESIALAPYPSVELILSILNRSCFLKHLGKYRESIMDINYALKFNVESDSLKIKLLCRKIICLRLLNKTLQAHQPCQQ